MTSYSDFDCKLKYRLYNNDDAFDYDQFYDTNFQLYKVRQEFDLRFFCTWSNIGKLIFLVIFESF